jgi:hypothetical protein
MHVDMVSTTIGQLLLILFFFPHSGPGRLFYNIKSQRVSTSKIKTY